MLLKDDPYHQRRKLLLPFFHRERMATYRSLIELINEVFRSLSKGETFSARDSALNISLQAILQVVYGISNGERDQKLKFLISKMTDVLRSLLTSVMLFFPQSQRDVVTAVSRYPILKSDRVS